MTDVLPGLQKKLAAEAMISMSCFCVLTMAELQIAGQSPPAARQKALVKLMRRAFASGWHCMGDTSTHRCA